MKTFNLSIEEHREILLILIMMFWASGDVSDVFDDYLETDDDNRHANLTVDQVKEIIKSEPEDSEQNYVFMRIANAFDLKDEEEVGKFLTDNEAWYSSLDALVVDIRFKPETTK